jgi:hypothetical protein
MNTFDTVIPILYIFSRCTRVLSIYPKRRLVSQDDKIMLIAEIPVGVPENMDAIVIMRILSASRGFLWIQKRSFISESPSD